MLCTIPNLLRSMLTASADGQGVFLQPSLFARSLSRHSCSWLLLRHLARIAPPLSSWPPSHTTDAPSETVPGQDLAMPSVTYEEARRIMTRTDFLDPLDHSHVGVFFLI